MRQPVILMLLQLIFLTPAVLFSQTGKDPADTNERPASFPGGEEKLLKYLMDHLKYPAEARISGISGTVYIKYTIDKDGSVTDVRVERGVHPLLDSAAVEVIRNMPKWNPGVQGQKYVKTAFVIPIQFIARKKAARIERAPRRLFRR
jgi:TonB family protein